jgi:hypothetical protein
MAKEKVVLRRDAFWAINVLGFLFAAAIGGGFYALYNAVEVPLPQSAYTVFATPFFLALAATFYGSKKIIDHSTGTYESRQTLFGIPVSRKVLPFAELSAITNQPRRIRSKGQIRVVYRISLSGQDVEEFIETCYNPQDADKLTDRISKASGLGVVEKPYEDCT